MRPTIKSVIEFDKQLATKEFDQIEPKQIAAAHVTDEFLFAEQKKFQERKKSNELNKPAEIDLSQNPVTYDFLKQNYRFSRDLDLNISSDHGLKFMSDVLKLIRDPKKIAKYLKPLNAKLAQELKKERVELEKQQPYQYLIKAVGMYLIGPYKEDYRPISKHKILDRILLEEERAHDININGVASFLGYVNSKAADEFVIQGNIFKEDVQLTFQTLHGKNIHRLIFEIIRQAMKAGELDLRINDPISGKERQVTQKELLHFLINSTIKTESSKTKNLWNFLIDSNDDIFCYYDKSKDMFDSKYYNFSSRSPFAFNSLLLCFGEELEIPELSNYLADSHYKAVYQMMQRIRDQHPQIQLDNDFLYCFCMEQMSISRKLTGTNFVFNADIEYRKAKNTETKDDGIMYKRKPSAQCENPESTEASPSNPSKKNKHDENETWEEYGKRKKQEAKNRKISTSDSDSGVSVS